MNDDRDNERDLGIDDANVRPDTKAGPAKGIDPYDYESIFDPEAPMPRLRDRINWKAPRVRRRVIVVALGLVVLLSVAFVYLQFDPSGDQGAEIQLEVAKGATTEEVAKLLDSKGVIPSAFAFRIAARFDDDYKLEAGEYNFRLNSSTSQAIDVLQKGPKVHVERLTIPEGFRLAQ